MTVIFLDIDGVLNCATTTQCFDDVVGIDPKKVVILKRVLEETRAHLVLSSSWRIDQDWRLALSAAGLPLHYFVGMTGRTKTRVRGEEIALWLDQHRAVKNYAILDDGPSMLPGQVHFKTTWEQGLTDEIADAIIEYFKTN